MERLVALSETLGSWIVAAQKAGQLDPGLPPEVILYTLLPGPAIRSSAC